MANLRLGKILRTLRIECGYTQQAVADMLGMKNKSTLGSWEIGKSEPDVFTLLKLCQIYKVSDIYNTFLDVSPPNDVFILSDIEQKIIMSYRECDNVSMEMVHRALNIDSGQHPRKARGIS